MEFAFGVFTGITSLVLAYLAYRSQQTQAFKRLHYTSKYMSLLTPRNDSLLNRVKVRAAGRDLINPTLFVIRIENTGKSPLTPGDFASPIRIVFGEHAWICHGTIEWNRADLFPVESDTVEWDRGGLRMKPFLLNPHDQVTLLAVTDGIPEVARVTTRLAGVEEVVHIPPLTEDALLTLDVRSLLFPLRDDWPTERYFEVQLFVMPLIIDPEGRFGDGVRVKVDGASFRRAYYASLLVKNRTRSRIASDRHDRALELNFSDARILTIDVEVDSQPLTNIPGIVTGIGGRQLKVTIPTLESESTLAINFFLGGNESNVVVASRPTWIDDVKIMEITTGKFVEKNLADLKPRVLLSTRRLYRLWHEIYSRLSSFART